MCAIIGSFDRDVVRELIKTNQHRGRVAYSLSLFNVESGDVHTVHGKGEFDLKLLENIEVGKEYILCHLQSPTGVVDTHENRVHPSMIDRKSYLWHNGILMPFTMNMIQEKLAFKSNFDTHLLHHWLNDKYNLDDIDGSFACVHIENGIMKVFRSRHAKLYIDNDMTISSERFDGSMCIKYDCIYRTDFGNKRLIVDDYFKTKHFNITIKGELDD